MGPFATSNPVQSPMNQSGPQPSSAPSGSGGYSPSDMMGDAGQDQAQASQSDALSAVVDVFRDIESQLLTVARQFPGTEPSVRAAIAAVRKVLESVISNPQSMGQGEPPSPGILG